MNGVHAFSARSIDGRDVPLADFRDKVLLIVNVASACGLTPQYAGLEKLYRDHRDEGLVVLGFPCNQFGAQEPGTDAEIASFCKLHYDVSFPMFSKVEVNGPRAHPLFSYLTSCETEPEGKGPIAWNFGKFLVGRDGSVRARFAPTEAPTSERLLAAVRTALAT